MKPLILSLLLITILPLHAEETLTLEAAWRMALAESPSEAVAQARLEQAEARWRQARSAYQPRLALTAQGAYAEPSDSARLQNPLLPDSLEQYEAGLRATYLIWDGGARRDRTRGARAGADAAAAALEDSRLDLLASVGRAFTSAQLARENLRIAQADADFQRRQLEDIRRREAAGAASRADRLNFEIRGLAAENAAISAEAGFAAAMAALTALLGQPAERPLPPPAAVDRNAPVSEAPGFEAAWDGTALRLPALQRAQLQVDAAEAAIGAARGTLAPSLAAFGDATASRLDDPGFGSDDLGTTVGLQLSWELWDGGLRRQQVAEARAVADEARAGRTALTLQAQAELVQALSEYNAAVQAEALAATTLDLTRENRDLVETAFRAGQESLLRLNEAQRDFTNAESRAVQAHLTRVLAWIELQRAMGLLAP